MRRTSVAILALATASTVAACGDEGDSAKKPTVSKTASLERFISRDWGDSAKKGRPGPKVSCERLERDGYTLCKVQPGKSVFYVVAGRRGKRVSYRGTSIVTCADLKKRALRQRFLQAMKLRIGAEKGKASYYRAGYVHERLPIRVDQRCKRAKSARFTPGDETIGDLVSAMKRIAARRS